MITKAVITKAVAQEAVAQKTVAQKTVFRKAVALERSAMVQWILMALISLLTRRFGCSLHLPAHRRGAGLPDELRALLRKRAGVWDLPELPEIGGPLESDGAVAESQRQAAAGMGVDRCWYGVNGATGLLQAALLALARPGQYVLMPRNVHRSLIEACVLADLTPVFFDLPFLVDRGHVGPADEAWLKPVLNQISRLGVKIAAAVLVHPTYQGYASDPLPLIAQFHRRGWPVLVDEAHGSHFASGVDPCLPRSAISAGADLVVHSLHKSAAGLTQTAVLWSQGDRVDRVALERSIGWLQTTSPSALLLASCEAALNHWQQPAGRKRLKASLEHSRMVKSQLAERGVPLSSTQDPLKLIWHTAQAGISGLRADQWLMNRGLVAELPEPGCLTFCLGLAPQRGLVRLMTRRWRDMVKELAPAPGSEPLLSRFVRPPLPLVAIPARSPAEAWRAKQRQVALGLAGNCIAAELICPYPPGIPLVVPGERLDQDRVAWLVAQQKRWPAQIAETVAVMELGG
ncbi:MAG: aminotransferase class I/II-fold pyridoxal phosphate-dependent enzyme [Prochlorococcus sp.]